MSCWIKSHHSQSLCAMTQSRSWVSLLTQWQIGYLTQNEPYEDNKTGSRAADWGRERAKEAYHLLKHLQKVSPVRDSKKKKTQIYTLSVPVLISHPYQDIWSSYFSRPEQNNSNSTNLTNRGKKLQTDIKWSPNIERSKAKCRTVCILTLSFEFLKAGGKILCRYYLWKYTQINNQTGYLQRETPGSQQKAEAFYSSIFCIFWIINHVNILYLYALKINVKGEEAPYKKLSEKSHQNSKKD